MSRTADAIITPTESVRVEVCELLKANPGKVFAIPEAARACFKPLSFAETANARRKLGLATIFCLRGTLEPRKNLSVLISALAELAPEDPRATHNLLSPAGVVG